ncbi:alpha/beta fold hydrolase [Streptomonospora wellingtoniae]|uniref:Alpha/beta hydrolase n=1 Tax=Streptomonospora wellingtoniae TaxID=3075544 RepID=A0ABU2KWI9_9ACTN|nr:alpha/beta hydrolase [Streptomonospora sp. DSM 45055]MDT0303627.1 alpha/beta hydrolase [Streptomonospora sp. DSM 45055]
MSETPRSRVVRTAVQVDGEATSYLTVEQDGPVALLLHGTYWSRVWLPVLDRLAQAGLRPVAVDFPGLGRSEGELTLETAAVPNLADWVARFAAALGISGPVAVAGHDIGGGVAQHLLAHDRLEVPRLALVNSVTYDSWPVPGVARYRDPEVVAATTADDFLAARRRVVAAALAGAATEQRIVEYLDPWTAARVRRSWMALAGAADSRYTRDLVPALRRSAVPKLLVWGEDDGFQKVEYAERFASEIPQTTLVRIPEAGHIPMENAPGLVARALADFFTA